MPYYTMHLDTEGERGRVPHEVAYVIREKNTCSVSCARSVSFYYASSTLFDNRGDHTDKFLEFFEGMRDDMATYGINHINTWGNTDFSSITLLFGAFLGIPRNGDKYDEYAGRIRMRYTFADSFDCLRRAHYRNAYDYCERVYKAEEYVKRSYDEFREMWIPKGSGGPMRLQNLTRFVLDDPFYKQEHTALSDAYDAQMVTLFFSKLDHTKSWD